MNVFFFFKKYESYRLNVMEHLSNDIFFFFLNSTYVLLIFSVNIHNLFLKFVHVFCIDK